MAVAVLVAVAVASASQATKRHLASSSHLHAASPVVGSPAKKKPLKGIHKIKHIVIIMQENRSFDNYFGTYKGADGIPGLAGHKGKVPCLPQNEPSLPCVQPFHDKYDFNIGGGYYMPAAVADIDGGKMDGFVQQQQDFLSGCGCGPSIPANDAMGYHTRKDIPNYWKYADDFVLQDHMFSSVAAWSLPSHLYLTSLWSAVCKKHNHPKSCTNSANSPQPPPPFSKKPPIYAWTDLTYLLHKHHVSWRYYYFKGTEPACETDTSLTCTPRSNGPVSASIWYPAKWFDTVKKDKQAKDVQSINGLFSAAQKGTLPSVSWVVPNSVVSEHANDTTITPGQTYVTGLINTIMQSPDWKSTAIFLTWDDWSGFYDNAVPPEVDENGYGLRVPGLVISPYAKKGYIDHQVLSFDAYAKFIEDDFLGGARIDGKTDGRPDPRPDVREKESVLGNLIKDFNFKQKPRNPVILSVHPTTDLIEPSNSTLERALRASSMYRWG